LAIGERKLFLNPQSAFANPQSSPPFDKLRTGFSHKGRRDL
jgi:hypothetical protein